jgi:hypothetical protein
MDKSTSDDASDSPSAVVRYVFVAIFVAACLYKLELGVRVAGVFLLGMSLYQGVRGKVPLTGYDWRTQGYLTGAAALAVSVSVVFVSVFFIVKPDLVIGLLAATHGLPVPTR